MDVTQQLSFSFPSLKNSEILDLLANLGIPFTEEELLEPSRQRDTVRNLFILLIEVTLGIQQEELFTPSPEAVAKRATLPYPEMHETSLGEIKFIKTCIRMMNNCGISDFGMRDLYQPCSKRLRRHLSAVINFLRFIEDKIPLYSELDKERQKSLQELEAAQEEHITLKEQLEDAQLEHEQGWHATQEAEKECAELELEITQLNKLQASIRQENNSLKKVITDLTDKIATTTVLLDEAKATKANLMAQVVQSPDRMKREMKDALAALESQKKDTALAEREIIMTKKKIETIRQTKEELLKAMKQMGEVETEKVKLQEVEKEVSLVQSRISQSEEETLRLQEAAEETERHWMRIEEKIQHARKQHTVRMEAARQSLEQAQRELMKVEQEQRDEMAQVNLAEAAVMALENKIEQQREQSLAELSQMMAEYKKLEQFMLQHTNELMKAIGCTL